MNSDIYPLLLPLADNDFCEFSKKIISSNYSMLGVRIPEIRKIVKAIPKDKYEELLAKEPTVFEEVIARGFMIAQLPYDKMLSYFDSQVVLFDNWCAVDTFCASLKSAVRKNKDDFLHKKVENLLKSKNEFVARCGVVCLLDFYVCSDYLDMIFDYMESLSDRSEYYVKMAVAWLLAECFIKFPERTLAYMKNSKLEKWTYNKAISKICDSYRVGLEAKNELKKMRKP